MTRAPVCTSGCTVFFAQQNCGRALIYMTCTMFDFREEKWWFLKQQWRRSPLRGTTNCNGLHLWSCTPRWKFLETRWTLKSHEKPWKTMKKAWWFCLVHRFLSVCVIRFIAFFRWKNPFPQGPLPSIGKIERTTIDGARFQHVPGAATWPGPSKAGDLPLAIFHMWRMEIPQ